MAQIIIIAIGVAAGILIANNLPAAWSWLKDRIALRKVRRIASGRPYPAAVYILAAWCFAGAAFYYVAHPEDPDRWVMAGLNAFLFIAAWVKGSWNGVKNHRILAEFKKLPADIQDHIVSNYSRTWIIGL